MKKYTLLSLSVAVLTACTIFEPVPAEAPYAPYSLVAGDTVKTREDKNLLKTKNLEADAIKIIVVGEQVVTYKEPKLHTPPAKDPDLSKIKNNEDPDLKGKPLRMVAIGGSLTAGVRDGGYFNEGIMTSYPNLIARQMKLKKFEQPLFNATDYNGYGRKVRTDFNPTGGPVPKYLQAANNSGIASIDEKSNMKLKKYSGDLDNFAIPRQRGSNYAPSVGGNSENRNNYDNSGYELIKRISYVKDESITDMLFKKKFDIMLIETGYEEIWGYLFGARTLGAWPYLTDEKWFSDKEQVNTERLSSYIGYFTNSTPISPPFMYCLEAKKRNTKNVVLVNTPNFLDFPYFKTIKSKDVDAIYSMASKNQLREISSYLPTSTIDSLISPKVHISLKPWLKSEDSDPNGDSFISNVKLVSYKRILKEFNDEKEAIAKKFNHPLVDLKSLFDKILRNEFTTDDGVKVDSTWPIGNFFSNDGVNPTAFGQAVIANEVIKTMNSFYKTEIPMIPTREYLLVK